jgi:hypothetical protein
MTVLASLIPRLVVDRSKAQKLHTQGSSVFESAAGAGISTAHPNIGHAYRGEASSNSRTTVDYCIFLR